LFTGRLRCLRLNYFPNSSRYTITYKGQLRWPHLTGLYKMCLPYSFKHWFLNCFDHFNLIFDCYGFLYIAECFG
jgi:hypothetical protein